MSVNCLQCCRLTLVSKCTSIPGLSDHNIVLTDTNIIPLRQKSPKRLYFWYGRRPSSVCKNLHLRVSVDTPINSLWTSFKTKSLSSISKHVPSKMTSSGYSRSWCNRNVRRLSRQIHRAFRKARLNSNRKNWTRYKNIQKACKDEYKKAYNNYVCDMVNDASNCKKLYSFVKDKKCDSSGVAPLKKDGTTNNDATTKSEILNGQFLSAFTTEDTRSFPDLGASHYPDAPEITVHPNGVRKLLRNLNKATGQDDISRSQGNGRAAHSYTDSDFLGITQTRKDARQLEGGECFSDLQKGR